MSASRRWQGIISRVAAVAKGLAVKLRPWRAREAMPAMIGTPPSKRPMWHDPAEHARDFAERYAEPMNYHVENRMMELAIPGDRIGARKYGYQHRAFWPEETTGGGNVPGRRLTVDSGVFNPELMASRTEAGEVWAKSRLRDRIDAIIAHEDAESLTGDHDLAEAMASDTTLPITDGARQILGAIRGNPRER
jgi:hypothetical protein